MTTVVTRIVNKPISSNTYVIFDKDYSNSCIIVDPGTEDCEDLIEYLNVNFLYPQWIILTHEHFDHILGVNKLKKLYKLKIICSKECSISIISKKKNLSIFYDKIGFESCPADVLIENIDLMLHWHNYTIEFIKTEGHTEGSMCILIANHLFTGDTLLKNNSTVTKLPGGNKVKLENSFKLLDSKFSTREINVYPGHGEIFKYGG